MPRSDLPAGPMISVVIPTLGRNDALERTLDHLERQSLDGAQFEVIVVLDAQAERRESVARSVQGRSFRGQVIAVDVPGASAARNRGWRVAGSDLILFLGDDILAAPRLLDEHLEWHQRRPDPEVGVLGHVRWARELRVTPFMRWLERGIQFDYPSIAGLEAGWGRFYTANVSVKRAMLEQVGGFNEVRLPFLYEDLDLAYRMSEHGFRLLYNCAAEGEHLHAVDIASWRLRARQIAIAEHEFVALHPEVPPYFHRLFEQAAKAPRARGRGARLLRYVSPETPWIGRRAWLSADLYFRQALASEFLSAWDATSSGGSSPAGPK